MTALALVYANEQTMEDVKIKTRTGALRTLIAPAYRV